jgi:FkbM family methyltransferase
MALRNARCSYSQYGEDAIAEVLLGHDTVRGVYVDIGCFEPVFLSNTYKFYLKGWSGLAIDPNKSLSSGWRKWRPRDTFITAAVGLTAHEARYLESVRPNENRIDAEGTIVVPVRPLSSILDEYLPHSTIDLMSFDCEGQDFEAIQSTNLLKWRPRVMIVEESETSAAPIRDLLSGFGYECLAKCRRSAVYALAGS